MPASLPGNQASTMAGTRVLAQLMSSGRPLSSTSTTGLPVATTASSRACWLPCSASDATEAASPLMLARSPSTSTTTSAARAASTAFSSSACCSAAGISAGAGLPWSASQGSG